MKKEVKGGFKMKKKIFVSTLLGIVFLLSFVSATTTNVLFNGEFKNGTTLYSDWYSIENSTLYGRDVYPIHENCSSTQVCAKYNYSYEKTCTKYYSDLCRRYAYHYERQCIHYASYNQSKCLSYKKVKIQDECIDYREDLCRIYKTTKIKGDCIANRTIRSCQAISPIGCLDPATGVYTNQLALSNFKMSLDSETWQSIPYDQQLIENSDLIFKVDIPSVCSPTYDINKSIYIAS